MGMTLRRPADADKAGTRVVVAGIPGPSPAAVASQAVADNELGAFLRARRAALTPAEVGLPAGAGRRTPGLRRSEVATLAGVSVEYLIRLEQGRDQRPSARVLSALADALRLTVGERVQLRTLAKCAEGGFSCVGGSGPGRVVRPTVQALLDRLDPTPALLVNRVTEIVGATSGYRRLAGPLGLLDGRPPNLARYVFTDPRARSAFPDWARMADQQVAVLKRGPFRTDPFIAELVDELAADPEFARRVEEVPGPPAGTGLLRMTHPDAGELRLAYETLDLPADDDLRLVVHLPADPATAAALDGLRPTGLRAV
jgi:transcriptional regulator with XRE-family HTH domain